MEKDRLQYTIGRLDHYFDSINNKTNVYIGINTFLIGAILTLAVQFKDSLNNQVWLLLFISIALLLGFLNFLILARLSIPYSPYHQDSLYYFRSISEMGEEEFSEESKERKEKDDLKDLRNQVYKLSYGLNDKFKKLTWVGILLISQFFLLIPIIFLILKKII